MDDEAYVWWYEWKWVCDECGRETVAGRNAEWLRVSLMDEFSTPVWEERLSMTACGVFCSLGCLVERVNRVKELVKNGLTTDFAAELTDDHRLDEGG